MSINSVQSHAAARSADNARINTSAQNIPTAQDMLAKNRLPNGRIDMDMLAKDIAQAAQGNQADAKAIMRSLQPALRPAEQGELERLVDKIIDAVRDAIESVSDFLESIFGGGESSPSAAPNTGATNASDLTDIASPSDAPQTISVSPEVQAVFDEQWANSLPGGKSLEQGGTLVRNKETGEISIQNIGGLGSTSGSFSPNTQLADPEKYEVLGVFHTHPYDASEGGHTNVSLSGGDAGYMINEGQSIIIAQSGQGQYAYVRTAETPDNVDYIALNEAQNNRVVELMGEGKSFSDASRQAALETADAYGLAYYEGSNGTFTRVDP